MLDLEDLNFVYRKHKKLKIIFIFYSIIVMSIISFSLFLKIPNKYITNGIVKDNYIVLTENVLNAKKISQSYQYEINNSLFILDSFKYSDIYSNGNINIQEIQFTNKTKKENNEIVEITFYYNKDLIIKKIMKGVFN